MPNLVRRLLDRAARPRRLVSAAELRARLASAHAEVARRREAAKLAEFEELLSRSSLGTPTAQAIAALTTDEDVADIHARLAERRKEAGR